MDLLHVRDYYGLLKKPFIFILLKWILLRPSFKNVKDSQTTSLCVEQPAAPLLRWSIPSKVISNFQQRNDPKVCFHWVKCLKMKCFVLVVRKDDRIFIFERYQIILVLTNISLLYKVKPLKTLEQNFLWNKVSWSPFGVVLTSNLHIDFLNQQWVCWVNGVSLEEPFIWVVGIICGSPFITQQRTC